jgi:membrane fusion protein, heavy metal efflux system
MKDKSTDFMQKIIKKIFIGCMFLFSAIILLQSCKSNNNADAQQSDKYVMPDSLFRTLKIDTVTKCPLVNSITLTGQVAFNDDKVSKLYPMVSGNIEDIKVMLGDYVTAGQTLGVIRSTEMAGYSNDLVNAQTNLGVAKKNLDATEDMFSSGLASQKDVLSAQASYEQAKSELNRVNSVLKINGGSTQGDYVVKSPIDGFVVEKFVTNDMAIRSDNGTNLFTICDLSNVWVMANVYESNITNVHLGDSVNVTTLSYPDKIFKGKIDKILNVLDPTSKVMKVRVVLPNPGYLLKPEMFASVTIDTKENQEAICVPSQALVFDNSQYYVLVYKSNSDIEIKPVRVINSIGNKTFISVGVDEGDIIIGSQALLIYQALNA